MEPVALPVDMDVDFELFYRSSYPGAVRLAWLLTHDASLCEDVAQDAFARVHERFAGLERPEAYLRVAIVNGCRERPVAANVGRAGSDLFTLGPTSPGRIR